MKVGYPLRKIIGKLGVELIGSQREIRAHTILIGKHPKDKKNSITDPNSSIILDASGIEHTILHYFQSIYSSNHSTSVMQEGVIDQVSSEGDVLSLDKYFTPQEVTQALKHIKGRKAPGPDSVQACFLHKY